MHVQWVCSIEEYTVGEITTWFPAKYVGLNMNEHLKIVNLKLMWNKNLQKKRNKQKKAWQLC